ncbi:hypothetical protein KQX54_002670 [Cotesia glomerata]|uniref:Uncharacterized protein n=1 Tax=Cotesia glomerata TaxID=32391 RepID=A0AAV7IHE6_COTGL|nr:hypothetical protein KQX54_002670 [Cotesia glomerata]
MEKSSQYYLKLKTPRLRRNNMGYADPELSLSIPIADSSGLVFYRSRGVQRPCGHVRFTVESVADLGGELPKGRTETVRLNRVTRTRVH